METEESLQKHFFPKTMLDYCYFGVLFVWFVVIFYNSLIEGQPAKARWTGPGHILTSLPGRMAEAFLKESKVNQLFHVKVVR